VHVSRKFFRRITFVSKTSSRWIDLVKFTGLCAIFLSEAVAGIEVVDDMGDVVALKNPAQRVVSLSPHLTELVFAVDGGSKLVGAMSFSDYPEAAKKIPRVGSHNTVNYESIIKMQPDLVLAWASGNGLERINKLKSLGFSVYVSEPSKLKDIASSLRKISMLLGENAAGDREADSFFRRLTKLKKTYTKQLPVSVFYQLSDEPMITLNGRHIISDVITLCGGRNVFYEALPLVLKVSAESLMRSNPQVVIAGAEKDNQPRWLSHWKQRPPTRAVSNKHIYFIPPDLLTRHTPRIIDGAKMMCDFLSQARNKNTKQGISP